MGDKSTDAGLNNEKRRIDQYKLMVYYTQTLRGKYLPQSEKE